MSQGVTIHHNKSTSSGSEMKYIHEQPIACIVLYVQACISAVQDFHLHDVSSINVLRKWVLHKQKRWEEVGGCTQRLQTAWPWRFLAIILWRPWLALDGLLLPSYAQFGLENSSLPCSASIDNFRSLDRRTLAMSADFQGLVNEGVWLAGSALVQFCV